MAILGIDVGGTFTDAVLLDDGDLRTAKVPTAAAQEESVVAAARAVGATAVERFSHGTTIATNALLERKGARTAFVATEGFEHLLHLRRQTRAHLYRLCDEHPEPLVPLERCHGVRERIGPDGVLVPLDLDSLPDGRRRGGRGLPALLVSRSVARAGGRGGASRGGYPGVHVVASHEVAPEFREYERASTTAADAYLGPVVRALLPLARRARCREAGLPEPLVMRSSGGVATIDEAAAHAALVLVSGPGRRRRRRGADRRARRRRERDLVRHGRHVDRRLPDRRAAAPSGRSSGRSAACRSGCRWSTSTRSARAAARSSGATRAARSASGRRAPARSRARPATAAAATRPTVTDANLLLGRLPERLAGGVELDREAAERALGGLDPADVVEVVNAEMLRALRVVSVERGHDPRDFALVAFGGAGPLHACALAEELGIGDRARSRPRRACSRRSASWRATSGATRVRSYVCPLDEAGELPAEGEADLRYRGQSFELTVPLGDGLAERFHRAHEERYGYADPDRRDRARRRADGRVRPGPGARAPAGDPLRRGRPGRAARARRRHLLDPPGWVGDRDGTLTSSTLR